MKILALETSGMSGSVATFDTSAETTPREVRLAEGQRSARALAPAIGRSLAEIGWQPGDVNVVAVTIGPGSFTGLRIGITTAKMLAYAWKADVIAVDTLDVLARQTENEAGTRSAVALHTILDAHRQELFTAQFNRDGNGRWQRNSVSRLIGIDAWLASLQPDEAVTGPMLDKLVERLPPQIARSPRETWEPSAGTVARLAAEYHTAGRRDDPFQLLPHYLRLAAAEEKRLQTPVGDRTR